MSGCVVALPAHGMQQEIFMQLAEIHLDRSPLPIAVLNSVCARAIGVRNHRCTCKTATRVVSVSFWHPTPRQSCT